ncbi:MAG: tripartite tricarboxylate transporter substrate binding protein [Defluviitaleaceae bacterium]|nr:tripartite tricarboxylate transporter substrate binding protein [Defluviitaleaceae bacterium]
MKRTSIKTFTILSLLTTTIIFSACAQQQSTPQAPPAQQQQQQEPAQEVEAEVDFPTRTINITAPFAPGGGTDLSARTFQTVAPAFFNNVNFTVSNVTGGGGAVWFSQGFMQEPTGYEATQVTVEITTLPLLQDVPFTVDDYAFIAMSANNTAAISVLYDSPWETIEDFLEDARTRPGEVSIGTSGPNAIWDLHAHAVSQAAGVTFNHVPYEGAAAAIVALMGGEIDSVAVSANEVHTHVLDGTFRVLAVAANERLSFLPDVPTYQELGIPVPAIGGWNGMALPAATPPEIIQRFAELAEQVMLSDEFLELMERQNLTAVFMNHQDFTAFVREQSEFFSNLIVDLGLAE